MSKILDGKKLSGLLATKLRNKIQRLKIKPKLVIIQIGDVKESNTYIRNKGIFAEKIGARIEHRKYPKNIKEKKLLEEILKLNRDRKVHGIIVQEPLPKQISNSVINSVIKREKAVDGSPLYVPATTRGILNLLDYYEVPIRSKKVVIVGRSKLVGLPTALALIEHDATVTICHSKTKNLSKETGRADILIVAAGKEKLITRKHVRRGQVIIDVGININKERKVVGDTDYKNVSKIVKAISPVPGGVGPMTVASLFENLLEAYYLQTK